MISFSLICIGCLSGFAIFLGIVVFLLTYFSEKDVKGKQKDEEN